MRISHLLLGIVVLQTTLNISVVYKTSFFFLTVSFGLQIALRWTFAKRAPKYNVKWTRKQNIEDVYV